MSLLLMLAVVFELVTACNHMHGGQLTAATLSLHGSTDQQPRCASIIGLSTFKQFQLVQYKSPQDSAEQYLSVRSVCLWY